MIETSKDVLNIVIAISVAGLAFFICWALYYFALIMRRLFHIVDGLKRKIDKLEELIDLIKNKVENSTSYLFLIGEGVKKLVEIMKKREEKASKEE